MTRARFSITIPEALKARMNSTGKRLNWSAIAQGAIEDALDEIEGSNSGHPAPNIRGIMIRLRAGRQTECNKAADRGYRDGVKWAELHATYAELATLRTYSPNEGARKWVKKLTDGSMRDNVVDDYGSSSEPEDAYYEGFMEGALWIWNQADETFRRDRLES